MPLDELLARPVTPDRAVNVECDERPAPFANEPILELRRSAVRAAAGRCAGGRRSDAAARGAGDGSAIGERHGAAIDVDRSRASPIASSRGPRRERAERRRGRGRRSARAGSASGARAPARARGRAAREPPRGCASAGSSWPRSRSASARSHGPRPTPTCARRSTSSSTTPAAAIELDGGRPLLQVPGEHNELRYVPARRDGGHRAMELPDRDRLRDDRRRRWRRATRSCSSPPSSRPAARCRIVQALRAGGVPPAAISLLPGEGDVGAALVRRPDVTTIAFTGSLPVGLEIIRAAAEVAPGQRTSSASSPSSAARTA